MDEMEVTVTLRADAIRDLVARDGLTLGRLAEQAGCSRDLLMKMLAGTRRCSFRRLCDIAVVLRVQPTTIGDVRAATAA